MKLLLPLKHYDEQGRVKPLVSIICCLAFLCRGYILFILSMSYRQDSTFLLRLFYPQTHDFYASLAVGLPAFIIVALVVYRDKIWRAERLYYFKLIWPLLLLSLVADGALHLLMAQQSHWAFSWVIAGTLLIDASWLFYVSRSRYLDVMLGDWVKKV
ncbi:DUF2919 family protein [Alteromonadaceae bacterium BrNp21-10]|nr:DUF2919 family protein [Alteromonadaceae bacterium BrNp21-10]